MFDFFKKAPETVETEPENVNDAPTPKLVGVVIPMRHPSDYYVFASQMPAIEGDDKIIEYIAGANSEFDLVGKINPTNFGNLSYILSKLTRAKINMLMEFLRCGRFWYQLSISDDFVYCTKDAVDMVRDGGRDGAHALQFRPQYGRFSQCELDVYKPQTESHGRHDYGHEPQPIRFYLNDEDLLTLLTPSDEEMHFTMT